MDQNDSNNFKQLVLMIGENYNKPVSEIKLMLWWDLLKEYEYQDIHNAAYEHMTKSSYMATPADLIKALEPDYQEMFDRCLRRQGYNNVIEKVTWGAVGYACRTQLSEKDALARFAKEYKRQVQLAKQQRVDMTHQLDDKEKPPEPEVPVRPTDQIIDEGIEKYKGKTKEEIQQMMNSFKMNSKVKKSNKREF